MILIYSLSRAHKMRVNFSALFRDGDKLSSQDAMTLFASTTTYAVLRYRCGIWPFFDFCTYIYGRFCWIDRFNLFNFSLFHLHGKNFQFSYQFEGFVKVFQIITKGYVLLFDLMCIIFFQF